MPFAIDDSTGKPTSLLVHQGALGDWVLTWPTLRALAGEGLTLAASSWSKAVLAARSLPGVRPIDADSPDMVSLFGRGDVGQSMRQTLADLQTIICFVADRDSGWAEHISRLAPRARCVFVAPRPPGDWQQTAGQWHWQQMARQGVTLKPVQPATAGCADGPIVIHPGSGGASKCWPAWRFEELMDRLIEQGRKVQPILGEVEQATWPGDRLAHWQQRYHARLLGSLDELDTVLRQAACLVGNDSGPAHLAAQLGLPTVVLFGPTDPRVWRPIGPQVHVLAPPQPAPMDWLTPQQVMEALQAACGVA